MPKTTDGLLKVAENPKGFSLMPICLKMRYPRPMVAFLIVAVLLSGAHAIEPCRIEVVDAQNGWPVPLVQLTTNNHQAFVTDNAGLIAIDEPEVMGVPTWFSIEGHGYGVSPDGFGYRGVRLTPTPGGKLQVEVQRELPAQRLGRLTGGGLFCESQKLGLEEDWPESGVLGCDSVQTARHNGRRFWAWGDTTLPAYPLGVFHMTGGWSRLKPFGRLRPPLKFHCDLLRDEAGAPRAIARMPGAGPTWLSGLVSVQDQRGQSRQVASYAKIDPPLAEYESGLCEWDESHQSFHGVQVVWRRPPGSQATPPLLPRGHAVRWTDPRGDHWLLFGDPLPTLKCRDSYEAWRDPKSWAEIEPQETVPTRGQGEPVRPHRGAIAWSGYRQKWVTVFTQLGGEPSHLGELWYAEADTPTGPWRDAVKVVTHNAYTFYNPKIHEGMTDPGSPILLFEATYTAQFSGAHRPTPRYDYNQVLYRLDLDDPALTP